MLERQECFGNALSGGSPRCVRGATDDPVVRPYHVGGVTDVAFGRRLDADACAEGMRLGTHCLVVRPVRVRGATDDPVVRPYHMLQTQSHFP